jgi:hypothetical protein
MAVMDGPLLRITRMQNRAEEQPQEPAKNQTQDEAQAPLPKARGHEPTPAHNLSMDELVPPEPSKRPK